MNKRYPRRYYWRKIRDAGLYIKGVFRITTDSEINDNNSKRRNNSFKKRRKLSDKELVKQKIVIEQLLIEFFEGKIKDRACFVERREQLTREHKASMPSNAQMKELLKNTPYAHIVNKYHNKK